MADAQGRNPGEPGYNPWTDPGSDVNGGSPPPATSPFTAIPSPFTAVPGKSAAPPPATGIAGVALPTGAAALRPDADPMVALSELLASYPNNPQQAIDLFNSRFPGNSLAPSVGPNGTVGLGNGSYLVAPGSGGNTGTTWQVVQRGTGTGTAGDPGLGLPPGSPGLLDQYKGDLPPGWNPPPGATLPGAFTPPTYEDAFNDPGYQFTLGQGEHALENSAYAKGVGRTGGSLQNLIDYGQAAGTTQYGNVLNRDLGVYGVNQQNAKDQLSAYANLYGLGASTLANWQNGVYAKLYGQQQLGLQAASA